MTDPSVWFDAADHFYSTSTVRRDLIELTRATREGSDLLSGKVDELGSRLGDSIAGQTLAVGVMTQSILDALAHSSQLLNGILDTLRQPLGTAARERLARGIRALNNDWTDDAVEELREAIDQDRYLAPAHLMLGLAYDRIGSHSEACDSYLKAIKYSRPEPSLMASAVLLYSRHETLGTIPKEQVVECLADAIGTLGSCPEVLLRHAQLTGSRESLRRALDLAPELAMAAAAAGIEGLDHVADEMLADPTSVVGAGMKLKAAIEKAKKVVDSNPQWSGRAVPSVAEKTEASTPTNFVLATTVIDQRAQASSWAHDVACQARDRRPVPDSSHYADRISANRTYLQQTNEAFVSALRGLYSTPPVATRPYGETTFQLKYEGASVELTMDSSLWRMFFHLPGMEYPSPPRRWRLLDAPPVAPGLPCILTGAGANDHLAIDRLSIERHKLGILKMYWHWPVADDKNNSSGFKGFPNPFPAMSSDQWQFYASSLANTGKRSWESFFAERAPVIFAAVFRHLDWWASHSLNNSLSLLDQLIARERASWAEYRRAQILDDDCLARLAPLVAEMEACSAQIDSALSDRLSTLRVASPSGVPRGIWA